MASTATLYQLRSISLLPCKVMKLEPMSIFSQAAHANITRHCAATNCNATTSSGSRVALVTGASRGLGLEFVQQLLQRPRQSVVATCRQPSKSDQLKALADKHGNALTIIKLDVTDETCIQEAVEEVRRHHEHLDLLLNVAGVLHDAGRFSPETALARVELSSLQTVFKVNTFGPILVSKAFAPLLVNAKNISGASETKPAVIANLSARVGSIHDNKLGGWYTYRASKTALNQLTKTMAIEFQRRKQLVSCLLLHPGTVDTDLSAPFQKNVKPEKLFTRERAIKQLLDIIDNASMADTASFKAWDGSAIPW